MRSFTLTTFLALLLIAAGSAQAAPSVTGTFDLSDMPAQATLGPDGNIWVAFSAATHDYSKVTPDGTVTDYDDPNIAGAVGIVAGPDGNLWVTGSGYVSRFSPANPTAGTKTLIGTLADPRRIIVGPDGNLWTASAANVYMIPPVTTPTVNTYPTGIGGFSARGIASNSGKLWIANADNVAGGILPMSTAGTPEAQLTINAHAEEIASGPGGQLAYTAPVIQPERIGLINNGALATPLFLPPIDPFGVIHARDDAYWITQFGADNVARYTPSGEYSVLATFPTGSGPRYLTEGVPGTVWVLLEQAKKIVRISGVDLPDTTPPDFTKLSLTNKAFKVGAKKTALIAKKKKKTPTGTTLKYTLSEAITVNIDVHKAVTGRVKGNECVKPTSKLKEAKKCARYVVVGSFSRSGKVGANTFAFSGRYARTKLKPGKYRFLVYGKDAKGNSATPRAVKFTILKK